MIRLVLAAVVGLAVGCTSITAATTNPDAGGGGGPADLEPAPTYAQLFDALFTVGTAGHCAMGGCHGDPGHHIWLCGSSKDTCYQGMVDVGIISRKDPTHSSIADPGNSPLSWINPNGPMPFMATGPNPTAAAMIREWVAAGAQND